MAPAMPILLKIDDDEPIALEHLHAIFVAVCKRGGDVAGSGRTQSSRCVQEGGAARLQQLQGHLVAVARRLRPCQDYHQPPECKLRSQRHPPGGAMRASDPADPRCACCLRCADSRSRGEGGRYRSSRASSICTGPTARRIESCCGRCSPGPGSCRRRSPSSANFMAGCGPWCAWMTESCRTSSRSRRACAKGVQCPRCYSTCSSSRPLRSKP